MKALHTVARKMIPQIGGDYAKDGQIKTEAMTDDLPLAGLNVLEVGCGGGILSEMLVKLGCNLTAIDIAADLIEVAKEHASADPVTSKIKYVFEPVEEHAKSNFEKYDIVVSTFVLEHVNDHDFFIQSCVRCLKKNGSIFISAISKSLLSWLIIIYWLNTF
ncbi:hypothetical protein PPYR_06380 [Photinus pyralis]|uniref:Methyltransferase type 11 domain-containing protein n=1 Tax=Photinus pyralis TaxID=7054 RepID=A0A5N4ATU3_PHOPY|nr:hypothetical protein PPYR_06380 [Photinus pyralis]